MRLLRISLAVCVSLFLVYLVAINVFLSTALFGKVVNAKPEAIDVHYTHAWSVVPGRIHAKDVSVRGRDGTVEWVLRLDTVEFDVSFLAFARMRFETSRVRGTGTSFRLRERLVAAPSSEDEVADLPPIDGLPPYSVRPPSAPSPGKWSDEDYHLWSARLEDVVAEHVREVWIDHARFEGDARIQGRMHLKPVRAIEVGPARVAVARGAVRTGRGPVLVELNGSAVDLTLARFDPRVTTGADLLHHLSLATDLHAVAPDLARLPALVPASVTARGEVEVKQASLRVASGVLERDSHLEVTAPEVGLVAGTHRATGAMTLEADVAPRSGNEPDRLAFRAEATHLDVFQGGPSERTTAVLLRTQRAEAVGDARELDLTRPLGDLHLVVEVPASDLPEARLLSRYIPSRTPVAVKGGRASATARLEAWLGERRAAGSATLRAEDLDLRVAKLRLRGHTSVRAEFSSYSFDTRRLEDAKLTAEVSNASLATEEEPRTPLVHVTGLWLSARGHHIEIADPLSALDVSIAMPGAEVVAPGLLHAYLPKGSDMRLLAGHSRFSLEGRLTVARHVAAGHLDFEAKGLQLDFRDFRVDGDVRVGARLRNWDWERHDLAVLDASVVVAHPTITRRDAQEVGRAPGVSFSRIAVAARSPRFRIRDPLAKVSIDASFADARVHDASAIGAFLPEKAEFALEADDGGFGAELRADVDDHVARGQVRAHAVRMGVAGKTLHLAGDIDLFADVADWNFDEQTMSLLDSRVTFARVEGRLQPGGGPQFSAARVGVEARASRFDLARPTRTRGDFHLVVDEADLPDARALEALLPPGSVFGIESGDARADADLVISDSQSAAAGAVDITVARGAVRLGDTRLSGDFHVVAGLRDFSPADHRLGLSDARLEMRNVAVTGASATTSAWTGDIGFTDASLRLAPELLLDGVAKVDARDARPLLAVLFGSNFPGILVRITDVPRLIGSARVIVGTTRFAVLDLDAGGGSVGLRGSYAGSGDHRHGAVTARKWFLSVGVRLDDDGSHLRFFGLDGWLRGQRRAVMRVLEMHDPR